MFDRWFGERGGAGAARRAELRGDLTRAIELWMDAGAPREASRVMVLRGDAEPDARLRLQHFTQAAATAPAGTREHDVARSKRALLVIALAGDATVSATARRDVIQAAQDLEAAGEAEKAAEAFALAGDPEGEARALAKAGEIDKLEDLLSSQQSKVRGQRRRHDLHAEIELLVQSGRRRDALAAADALIKEQPDDVAARERAASLRARRAAGPVTNLIVLGKRMAFVLGDEVIIGRTEGAVIVPSQAISRRHVALARAGGRATLRDLASRNGTQLRGMNVAGTLDVGDGLDLHLGREVMLRVAPSAEVLGAFTIDIAGRSYVAPLGPATLPVEGWRIEHASDGWIELVTEGTITPSIDRMALVPRATLLVGDAIASSRGGEPVLSVVG